MNTEVLSSGWRASLAPHLNMIGSSLIYILISLALVFYNKYVFVQGFKFPVFVSCSQQIIGFALVWVLRGLAVVIPPIKPTVSSIFPEFKFSFRVAAQCFLMAIFFAISIAFSNICLQLVPVSAYLMARSSTIFFNIILCYLLLGEKTSWKACAACFVVVLGYFAGASIPGSLFGIMLGGFASIAQAFYNVFIKKILHLVKNNQNILIQYNMVNSAIVFIPLIYIMGEHEWYNTLFSDGFFSKKVADISQILLISTVLATALNISTYMVIKETNPVTFNIVAFLKSGIQTILGVVVLNETLTAALIYGVSFTLLGSFLYSYVKYQESLEVKEVKYSSLPGATVVGKVSTEKSTDEEI